MENAIFNTAEIVAYLHQIGMPVAAKAFSSDAESEEVQNRYVASWFRLYFGREQAYQLFREMECQVSQSINHLV
jgi:hypothetical protein